VEGKKINLSFGIVVITILAMFYIILKDFNNRRLNDYKSYISSITNIVKQKNNKIRELASQLAVEQTVIDDLKNTLAETRNGLDNLSKKIAQQAPAGVPTPVPAPAPVTQ
jgi:septal ring factor EnvC (AmiA/AmiB activator)